MKKGLVFVGAFVLLLGGATYMTKKLDAHVVPCASTQNDGDEPGYP